MAKAIRWQIPFVSVTDKHYRIDIYDEGWTGSITTLTAGPNPFTTDEDASDDFFAPIRTQTGNIEVCTAIPGGGMLTLDEILPANNIARPVRLMNTDSSTIEWQGFLSCEAYSQDYVGIPQILQLPVISVLEAMGSVEIEMTSELKYGRIIQHVVNALNTIQGESGMDLFTLIAIPQYLNEAIIFTSIYNNVYFRSDEVVSGENIIVEVHSISCKEILEQIAQFYGGVWREAGQYIFLHMPDNPSLPMQSISFGTAVYYYLELKTDVSWDSLSQMPREMASLEWRGTGHQRSVSQGKRRIKISADLKDFECDITLRECPVGSLVENPEERQEEWDEVYANTNDTFYNMAEHRSRLDSVTVELNSSYSSGKLATTNRGSIASGVQYDKTCLWTDDEYLQNFQGLFQEISGSVLVGTVEHYITSFMAWMRLIDEEEQEDGTHNTTLTSGLMLCGLPVSYRYADGNTGYLGSVWHAMMAEDYIFKQQTPLNFAASNGRMYLDIEIGAIITQLRSYSTWECKKRGQPRGLEFAIQWGDKWATYDAENDVTSWGDTFTTIIKREDADSDFDGKLHHEIPVDMYNTGIVTIYLFPKIYGDFNYDGQQSAIGLFITKMDLKYEPVEEELLSDRDTNSYIAETGTAFRDELEVSLSIASNAKNNKRATLIWSGTTTPKSLVTLGGERVRPEVSLINRMKTYYQNARQVVSLEVLHPDCGVRLPQIYFNGINDGKVYAPLAESRDWKKEISTLTCFETPNE